MLNKMVGHYRLVKQAYHTLLSANLCPTLLAKHRHLSVVSLLSRDIDSISAALNCQITPVETFTAPISINIHIIFIKVKHYLIQHYTLLPEVSLSWLSPSKWVCKSSCVNFLLFIKFFIMYDLSLIHI